MAQPGRDNPWLLGAGFVLSLAIGAFGIWAWMQILDGAAR